VTRRGFHARILGCLIASQARGGAEPRSSELRYLALESTSDTPFEMWPHQEREAASFGSLLKPFLAIAYGQTHASYPTVECRGAASGCWAQRGHGRQTLLPALANSCNSYFLALSREVDRAALRGVCLEYGLAEPPNESTEFDFIGLGAGWTQAPAAVLEAFHRLVQTRSNRVVKLVLGGMRLCAQRGTAKEARLDCFAKTGTAPCRHHPAAQGDGYAMLIFPVDTPRMILLAMQHETTGAHTAALAGELLRGSFRIGRA
jgi:cell division protein FtsI/penicillin-binding protein 2